MRFPTLDKDIHRLKTHRLEDIEIKFNEAYKDSLTKARAEGIPSISDWLELYRCFERIKDKNV